MTQRFVLAAALCWLAVGTNVVRGAEQTWTGAISDSMCGMSHAGMRTHGEKITDRECTIACLSYQTPDAPKYVFVTGGKVYPIANQKFTGLGRRSGEPIVLTGEIDGNGAMTIAKIEAVKKG